MQTFVPGRPAADEIPPFFAGYVARVPEADVVAALAAQIETTASFLRGLPESRGDFRYAPGKWTIKEVVGHLSDGERVFVYRALRFARTDTTPLPGFDENLWVTHSECGGRRLADVIEEYVQVRQASLAFFRSLAPAAWDRQGTANQNALTVRTLAYAIVGHERHHLETLRTRYQG